MKPTNRRKLPTYGLASLALAAALAVAGAACSSGGGPDIISDTTPPAPTVTLTQGTDADGSTTVKVVTVPDTILDLPPVDPDTAILEPTSEDAVYFYLFSHLADLGYTLVASCDGLTLAANPDKLCISEQKTDQTDLNLEIFTVSEPLPGVPWYRIYVENSNDGSRVISASAIGR